MAGEFAEAWHKIGPQRQTMWMGAAAGVVVGFVTHNIGAGVGCGAVFVGAAYYWHKAGSRQARVWVVVAVVPLALAVLYLTAVLTTPDPTDTDLSQNYNCGTVLAHPFSDPIEQWSGADNYSNELGQHAGITSGCSSGIDGFRWRGFTALGVGLAACGFAEMSERRHRRTTPFAPS